LNQILGQPCEFQVSGVDAFFPLPLPPAGGGPAAAPEALLVHIDEAKRAAARAGHFRLAAELADLQCVVAPRQASQLAAPAPGNLAAKIEFFQRNGFVCIPNVFEQGQLERLQAAWGRAQSRTFRPHGSQSTGFEIPVHDLFAEGDAALLDVLDPPPLLQLLEGLIGANMGY
jgi:hypothetical protein